MSSIEPEAVCRSILAAYTTFSLLKNTQDIFPLNDIRLARPTLTGDIVSHLYCRSPSTRSRPSPPMLGIQRIFSHTKHTSTKRSSRKRNRNKQ